VTRQIPLTKGAFALVDDADYDWLMQWKWRLNSKGYAIRSYYVDYQEIVLNMHRVILDAQRGQFVDHIDGNRLNNTRANLRFVTQQQNLEYRRVFSSSKTGLKGVSRRGNHWQARIGYNKQIIHLGYYPQIESAAHAYDAAALKLFGDYALLNFPNAAVPPEIECRVHEMLAALRLP
jgi:hypothetical protein